MQLDLPTWVQVIGLVGIPLALQAINYTRQKSNQAEAAARARDEASAKSEEQREARQAEAVAERQRENDRAHEELRKFLERLNQKLTDVELDIAQRYATMVAMRQLEERFFTVVERFEGKLDRVIERTINRTG